MLANTINPVKLNHVLILGSLDIMNRYLLLTCAMLLAIPAYASTDKLIENVKNKNLKAVEALLNSGEDVNGTNAQGNTALHYAVATNNADMVKLLLQHNADMNAQNTKGWSPLSIAEKKNVGNIYDILEAKQAKNKAEVKAAEEKAAKEKAEAEAKAKAAAEQATREKAEAEAKMAAEKEALRAKEEAVRLEAEKQAAALKEQAKKAAAEAVAKAEQKKAELAAKQAETEAAAKEKALKLQKAQSSAAAAKQLTEPKAKVKKNVVKPAVNTIIPLQKNTNKNKIKNKDIKLKNKKIKQAFKASPLSAKISQGDEEVVYCLQYLGLQGEQKNMTVAAGYYAVETGVSKARHDVAAAEAQKYYENASEADIKARADLCGKYITPKQAAKQNQIIRNLNKAIGF